MTASPGPSKGRSRRLRRARRTAFLSLAALPLFLWSCFPGPVRELWPPPPGEPRHTIDVVFRDWHTVIIEPLPAAAVAPGAAPGNASDTAPAAFREWEFCEKAWYLEGHQGCTGAVRSLLWPTASGVGCEDVKTPYWKRYPAGEVQRWTFVLSERGLRAMEAYLGAEKGDPLGEFPGWFAGESSYCIIYDCHHFTASALRAAGLPIRPWWAFSGWMIGIQLDRVRRFQEEELK